MPDWDSSIDAIGDDPDAEPAHTVRLGRIDPRGINHGDKDAERSSRYVTKYITKDVVGTARAVSDPQQAHFDRLREELSTLPCAPTCANWLLYGVQPKNSKPGLVPGRCKGRVYQPASLGFTGRRVLVSRQWSIRTVSDIRADNAAWVRAVLATDPEPDDQVDAPEPKPGDAPAVGCAGGRYLYELARPDDPDVRPYQHRLLAAIAARDRWRQRINRARTKLSATASEEGTGRAA